MLPVARNATSRRSLLSLMLPCSEECRLNEGIAIES